MSWIKKIFSSGAGSFVDDVSKAAKRFITTDKDRLEFQTEMENLLQQRDSEIEQTIRAELGAKERVLVAELQQDDKYTKRARPTVVYAGLVFIAFNYILIPMLGRFIPEVSAEPLVLPEEFWIAWGGICSAWVIGRSAEKRGVRNKLTRTMTGNPNRPSLLD